jgi:hypothetical protein
MGKWPSLPMFFCEQLCIKQVLSSVHGPAVPRLRGDREAGVGRSKVSYEAANRPAQGDFSQTIMKYSAQRPALLLIKTTLSRQKIGVPDATGVKICQFGEFGSFGY